MSVRVRKSVNVLILSLLVTLLVATVTTAYCGPADAPKIALEPATSVIGLDHTLNGTFTTTSDATLGATFIGDSVPGFAFDETTGAFTFTPTGTTTSTARILFYAVTPRGCVATSVAEYAIRHPPIVTTTPAPGVVTAREGRPFLFTAKTENATITWRLDGVDVAKENESYLYYPDFNAGGLHTLELRATSREGLTTVRVWNVSVANVNRAPVQVTEFIDVTLPRGGTFTLNLSLYFFDPDRGVLTFTLEETGPRPETKMTRATVTPSIEGELFTLKAGEPGVVYHAYTATDSSGATVTSRNVKYTVLNETVVGVRNNYCGDMICIAPEECASCPKDCGACDEPACVPRWDCTDWGECIFPGYQERVCIPLTPCANETEKPATMQACEPDATCEDGVKNGKETGVDCGGPCDACPTCNDGEQNQGEEKTDCGGPCDACPTCNDGVKNQDESDLDCGGVCEACGDGMRCRNNGECESAVCLRGICVGVTCEDGVKNGKETGVDCGGPCDACPTCNDGEQNQGEEKTDCGGPCDACPTCNDNVKNQGERLVDCDGPCRPCAWSDYKPGVIKGVVIALLLLVLLFAGYLARAVYASRLVFLVTHGKTIHFFYEDSLTYSLLLGWNSFAKHFRVHRHEEYGDLVKQAQYEIGSLRGRVPEEALRDATRGKLRSLYAAMFGLSASFEFDALVTAIKHARLPFPVRVILLRNTKFLALLELTRLYGNGGYAADEALRRLEELKKAF